MPWQSWSQERISEDATKGLRCDSNRDAKDHTGIFFASSSKLPCWVKSGRINSSQMISLGLPELGLAASGCFLKSRGFFVPEVRGCGAALAGAGLSPLEGTAAAAQDAAPRERSIPPCLHCSELHFCWQKMLQIQGWRCLNIRLCVFCSKQTACDLNCVNWREWSFESSHN